MLIKRCGDYSDWESRLEELCGRTLLHCFRGTDYKRRQSFALVSGYGNALSLWGSGDPMAGCLRVWITGGLTLLFVAGSQGTGLPQQSRNSSGSTAATRAVLTQYCVGCHSNTLKTGSVSLEALNLDRVGENPEVWEKVVRKLRGRMMPPTGRPRPDEGTYDAVVSHLERSLDAVAASNPNPGRTETFRRLNRSEYQNAIRDLLALDVDVTLASSEGRRQLWLR